MSRRSATQGDGVAVEVVPVAPDQWRQAADVQTRAFENDPGMRALFPDRDRYYRFFTPMDRADVRLSMLSGKVVEATPAMTAVATWTPPGGKYRLWAMARLMLRARRHATRKEYRALMRWWSDQDTRREELLPEPHWYLDFLAVEPHKQRFGLGAVLARHGLARADTDGVPVYLETYTATNHRFYTKLASNPSNTSMTDTHRCRSPPGA